jgi:uncharacterized repeat protein (TIGR04076 family)
MPKTERPDSSRRERKTLPQRTDNPSCPVSRREFCKAVPYTLVGGFSLSCLMKSLGADFLTPSSIETENIEEGIMAKKIIAVTAKVLSKKGTCGFHEVGDTVKFTESGVEGKICIHALYSMLPAVFAMMFDAQFPWLRENPDKKTHACPDAYNPVVFEIERLREK